MTNVIKTVITYPLNGSTRDFNIPFEYLARKFIQVTLIGRDRKPLTNIDDYRFTSKNQITTNRAWGTGDGYQLIELRRLTSATERLVDFSDGSILRAYDLNVSQIQTLHVAEEARDLTADTIGVNNEGHLDARGRRIVNVANPVNVGDAVNLGTIQAWDKGSYQNYIKSLEQANLAEQYKEDALNSKNNAKASEVNAKASEDKAKTSEDNAKVSEDNAKVSAQEAAQSAITSGEYLGQIGDAREYCLNQADRSYSEAERAKAFADSVREAKYVQLASAIEDDFEDGVTVVAKYGHISGDMAGGVFTYYKSRNLPVDGGVVFNVGSIGQVVRFGVSGRSFNGRLDVRWYGAMPGDTSVDNSVPINKALSSTYSNAVYVDGHYSVRNQIILKSRKSLIGEKSCWAYSDSGFNLRSTISLSANHTIPYGQAIINARKTRQTHLSYIDVDGGESNVVCAEYGYRVSEPSDGAYNDHEIDSCVFRSALIGLRSDYAGLFRVTNTQFTTLKEYGVFSDLTLSDSTFIGCYWNDIGYHGGLPDPSDPYNSVGAAIALGPHSGTAFIGGKIEWCRVGFHCIGTSALRVVGMWMDVFKQAAFRFIGSNQGAGESNIIQGVVINGAGWSTASGAAVEVHGNNTNMDVSFNGTITGSDESLSSNKESPTYGPKQAGIKVLNNKGVVTVGGDLINCSKSYSTYADGGSRIIDTATSNLPNVVAGLSVRNGYRYDAGSLYRGLILRDIPDHTPHNYGVEVGALYRAGNGVHIRVS